MNAQLKASLLNGWLATLVSTALIVCVLVIAFSVQPRPLPTIEGVSSMPWWAPFGGIAGVFAVYAGLMFLGRLGAGVVNGLVITANILASLAIDHFGWFHVDVHALSFGRIAGALLMIAGIVLISYF